MRQTEKNVSLSNGRRNTYVIQHLTDGLINLLKEKSLEDITISELCNSSGIGRASFYRNFKSKEDILLDYISLIFQEQADKIWDKPLNESLRILFSHFEKYKNFYEILNKRNLIFLIRKVILEYCGPKPENSKIEAYSRAYVAYALYGWIEVWFQRGMRESADEISDMFKNSNQAKD